MTTTHARYEDWLASIGNPKHHVVIGPDWWLCLCGRVVGPGWAGPPASGGCAAGLGTASAHVIDTWAEVRGIPGSASDVHQALWEAEAF
jgi:hypothetical protein